MEELNDMYKQVPATTIATWQVLDHARLTVMADMLAQIIANQEGRDVKDVFDKMNKRVMEAATDIMKDLPDA